MTTANKDLARERANLSFNVKDLTNLLSGGLKVTERRRFLRSLVDNDPVFDVRDRPFISRAQYYVRVLEKIKRLIELKKEHNLDSENYLFLRSSTGEALPILLHEDLFIPTLKGQMSDEQLAQWLPLAENYQIFGCYAQTELGHGSNLRKLETTATFIHETDEFELHSPTLTSLKWWPGALARSSNYAAVFARLILPDGKDYGMHVFLTQIRDENHEPIPGVEVGDIGECDGRDIEVVVVRNGVGVRHSCPSGSIEHGGRRKPECTPPRSYINGPKTPSRRSYLLTNSHSIVPTGPKLGFNSIDNGYLRLTRVRIPRSQMMMRFSKISRDGVYSQPLHDKLSYATMVSVRTNIVENSSGSLAKAMTIAIRYSAVRHQGNDPSGTGEYQVLDYTKQQHTLMTSLALTYALHYTGRYMRDMYEANLRNVMSGGDTSMMQDVHAVSSGLKAVCSQLVLESIETARQACGGE
ncbi:acyl-CoA dehydrogenase/oxidase [Jimgerdemannia flammicorona]|uniref:Acyl-CoA dehydrogenase/oxidase n=1 Tax=Jimgerdemannia flammicorona TaxID=994334 RepID=A0A433DCL5_9FUNG|nr:acyl-CoA dehydrogenase/oxidase [Jimgerdemannia flammicorona]